MTTVNETDQRPVDTAVERACVQFLFREAELLDGRHFREWLTTCLSEDLEYVVPIRTTRESTSGAPEFSTTNFHQMDTYAYMALRVDRLETEHAWAEEPPSRTRRFVTNVRVRHLSDDEVEVRSNLMLYRSQGSTISYDLLVGERQDVLRQETGGLRLLRRVVLLEHTILGTANLGVFL